MLLVVALRRHLVCVDGRRHDIPVLRRHLRPRATRELNAQRRRRSRLLGRVLGLGVLSLWVVVALRWLLVGDLARIVVLLRLLDLGTVVSRLSSGECTGLLGGGVVRRGAAVGACG